MSQSIDRKKRIALAMGLASFFGAGKASLAADKSKVSKGVLSSIANMSTSKKVAAGAIFTFGAVAVYEVLADTVGKHSKLPSLGKFLGIVGGEPGPGEPGPGKRGPDKPGPGKRGPDKPVPGKPLTPEDITPEDIRVRIDQLILSVYGQAGIGAALCKAGNEFERQAAVTLLAQIAKVAGITSESLKGNKVNKLDCFFVPIARAIGLSDEKKFSASIIKEVACHSFAEAQGNVKKPGYGFTEAEKAKILIITDIRNILNYKAGGEKGSNWLEGKCLENVRVKLQGLEQQSAG